MDETKTAPEPPSLFDLMERAAMRAAAEVPRLLNLGDADAARAAAELLTAATGACELMQRAALEWGKDGDK